MFARETMLACSVVNLQIRSSHGLLIRAALGLGNQRAPTTILAAGHDKAQFNNDLRILRQKLDHRSLNNYTTNVSSILYFQRKMTGSALISSKYRWMRSISSCLLATRIPRNMVRVILLN